MRSSCELPLARRIQPMFPLQSYKGSWFFSPPLQPQELTLNPHHTWWKCDDHRATSNDGQMVIFILYWKINWVYHKKYRRQATVLKAYNSNGTIAGLNRQHVSQPIIFKINIHKMLLNICCSQELMSLILMKRRKHCCLLEIKLSWECHILSGWQKRFQNSNIELLPF